MRIRTTATIARSNRKIFFAVSCSLNKKYAVSAVIKIYSEWIEVIKGCRSKMKMSPLAK